MKRATLTSFLFLAALMPILSACAAHQNDKVTLSVDFASFDNDAFIDKLKAKFPTIDFDIDYYRGRNPGGAILQKLEHADESDLILAPSLPTASLQKARCLDLCSTSYPKRYDALSQKDYTIDGHVYLLPGPSNARFFAYNQTLFEEKGWNVPTTLDDLLTLVGTISKDSSGITPISFAGANVYANASLGEALMQNYCLFKSDGFSWLSDYLLGTGSSAAGFDPATEYLKKLVAAKAFSSSDGARWNGDTFTRFVQQRKSAILYVYNGQKDLDNQIATASDHFGTFALPGWNKNNYLLNMDSMMNFGLSVRLGTSGNEAKLKAGLQVIDYLSSIEGMDALGGANNISAYPLRGASNTNVSSFVKSAYGLGDSSIEARSMDNTLLDVLYSTGLAVQKALFQSESLANLSTQIDRWHQTTLDGDKNAKYGEFSKDFSKEETAQFIADVIQNREHGDIALVTLGQKQNQIINEYGSSWGTIYQGKVKASEINIPVPKDGDIVTRPVNGATLIALLEKGRKIVSNDNNVAYFPFYFSGMSVNWKEGKILALTKNGAAIKKDGSYVLSYIGAGSLASSLKEISDEGVVALENAKETDTREAILNVYSGYLENHSPIAAPNSLSR